MSTAEDSLDRSKQSGDSQSGELLQGFLLWEAM